MNAVEFMSKKKTIKASFEDTLVTQFSSKSQQISSKRQRYSKFK